MKETELKEVMNEVVKEIYESAYGNLVAAHIHYRDYIDSNLTDKISRSMADEFKDHANEDMYLISKFSGRDYTEVLNEMPWPFSYDKEITKWWE